MFYTERQRQIIHHLETHSNVSVQELADLLFASARTIRRDLSELESIGILRRVHGGAVLTSGANFDTPAPMRRILQQTEKEQIAQLASCFLSSSTNYFFDSSSTVRYLALKLADYINVRIATNGLGLLSMLSSSNKLDVICCGGYLRSHFSSTPNITSFCVTVQSSEKNISSNPLISAISITSSRTKSPRTKPISMFWVID